MLGSLIWILVIGALAGWLAGLIMKGSGFGLLGDIVIGIVGSIIGGFLFDLVGLAAYGLVGRLLMAVVGAVVLLFIVKLIRRPKTQAYLSLEYSDFAALRIGMSGSASFQSVRKSL